MRPFVFLALFGTSHTDNSNKLFFFFVQTVRLLFCISLNWRVKTYGAVKALTMKAGKAVRFSTSPHTGSEKHTLSLTEHQLYGRT